MDPQKRVLGTSETLLEQSSPRKISLPRKFSGPPLSPQNGSTAYEDISPKAEEVPEGIVKGFGGAIEKTIAAQAAVADRSRGGTPAKSVPAANKGSKKTAPEADDKKAGAFPAEDLSSLIMLDTVLMRQWFLTACRDDTCNLKRLVREEPRLAQVRDFGNGYTGLHWAAHHGNVEAARFLVDGYAANVHARSRAGYTPLHIACMRNKTELIAVLVDHCHADPMEYDYSGRKPDHYLNRPKQPQNSSRSNRIPVSHRKSKTFSTAITSSMRRVGSFNAKIRSSMMRRMGMSSSNIKHSSSFPETDLAEEPHNGIDQDTRMMPPPSTVRATKPKVRSSTGIMRRGSLNSEVSRSDSVISIDDFRSMNSATTGKTFDSGSDSASFHGSESYDSFVSNSDSNTMSSTGKHSSPLIYTKTLESQDGGSQV